MIVPYHKEGRLFRREYHQTSVFALSAVRSGEITSSIAARSLGQPGWRRGMPIKRARPPELTFRYPFAADNLTPRERFVATFR
jgi:hypothetical protein